MSQTINKDELQIRLGRSPFINFLNLEVINVDYEFGQISMRLPAKPEFERSPETGQFHGGVIAAAIDTVGDYVLISRLGEAVPTINFRTDYLRPATGAYLVLTATIRRAGRTIGVVDIDVYDSNQKLVAVGRGCYSTKLG